MKHWTSSVFCVILGLFSGCAFIEGDKKLSLDETLPELGRIQVLSDVNAVGFEWQGLSQEPKASSINPSLIPSINTIIDGFVVYRADASSLNDARKKHKNTSADFFPAEAFKKIATIKNPFATHYFDSGLKPKSVYYYMFATLGANSTVGRTSRVIKVETSYVDAVEGVFGFSTTPTSNKLIITPHPNPSVKSYIIQRKNNQNTFSKVAELKHRFDIEFFDENLQDSKTYEYRVLAKDFLGNLSEPSEIISVRTLDLIRSVDGAQASKGLPLKVELKWEEHPDAIGYRIYVSDEPKGRYTFLAASKQTKYTHNLDEHGKTIYYQIVGIDEHSMDGKRLASPIEGSTLPPPQPPKITASFVENNVIIIEWEEPNDGRARKYALYRKEGRADANRYGNLRETKFIDKETNIGVVYTYSVVSVDEFGIQSAQSQSVSLSR